uniref:Uncharacterized protein n=1 Tax=Oryza punctata TaxID=4537 RepID=A0A0E0M6F8_ORYPU
MNHTPEETNREGLRDGRGRRSYDPRGRHSCSSMSMQRRESTGDEAMLRRAPLSITTTSRGGPRAATLQTEGATQR